MPTRRIAALMMATVVLAGLMAGTRRGTAEEAEHRRHLG